MSLYTFVVGRRDGEQLVGGGNGLGLSAAMFRESEPRREDSPVPHCHAITLFVLISNEISLQIKQIS